MKKTHILAEIMRTAQINGGVPLGEARFEVETGIRRTDWFGKIWAKWGDAVREAGYAPNELQLAFDDKVLLSKYSEYLIELGRIPTSGDLRLKRRSDPQFPSWNTFARFGNKAELVNRVMEFCNSDSRFDTAVSQCKDYLDSLLPSPISDQTGKELILGFVYLIKHGARSEYKIGRTNNPLRREGEIGLELPEKIEPIHVIETDDPAGIEAYWHRRFARKRMQGEWFELTIDDVRAFKRWRRIS